MIGDGFAHAAAGAEVPRGAAQKRYKEFFISALTFTSSRPMLGESRFSGRLRRS